MFIHREDKMNKDKVSDRPNIAEILVEKHRNGPTGMVELYFDDRRTTFLPIDTSQGGFDSATAASMSSDDDF
jgi:replicative DNA helicase